MKINLHTKDIVITSKQKSTILKKVKRLERFVGDVTPADIDIKLIDESGPEKGGVDQTVHINGKIAKDDFFIEETDDRLMRAFGNAYKTLERRLRKIHQKKVDAKKKNKGLRAMTEAVGRIIPKRRQQ